MLIDANLSEVKEIEALPSGIYSAIILKEPVLGESSQKKTPQLEFELTITDPGTEIAPGVARTITHKVYKSEKLGWAHIGMKQICKACGVPEDRPDTADFVNTELMVALTQEPYVTKSGVHKVVNNVAELLKKS